MRRLGVTICDLCGGPVSGPPHRSKDGKRWLDLCRPDCPGRPANSSPDVRSKTLYGLQLRNGDLARVATDQFGSELVDYEDAPVFLVENQEQLREVLVESVSSYNSSPERPGWGLFGRADLTPVAVRTTTVVMPLALEVPPVVPVNDVTDLSHPRAVELTGRDLPVGRYVLVRSRWPLGEAERFVGRPVRRAFRDEVLVAALADGEGSRLVLRAWA